MANQDLVSYISDAQRKGYSESFLRQALANQGWSQSDVNQAFASVRGGPQPAQVTQQPIQPQSIVPKSRKMKLRRIGVFSSAKISAVTAAILGLVFGIMFLIPVMLLGTSLTDSFSMAGATGADPFGIMALMAGLGVLAVLLFPVMFAIMGFISGAVFAFVYNLVAGMIGGYEIELEE